MFSARLQEPTLEDVGFRNIDAHISEVYAALDSSDWDAIAALPETYLELDLRTHGPVQRRWQSIPNAVLGLVDQDIVCPKCRKACDLRATRRPGQRKRPIYLPREWQAVFRMPTLRGLSGFRYLWPVRRASPAAKWNVQVARRVGLIGLGVVAAYLLLRHLVF